MTTISIREAGPDGLPGLDDLLTRHWQLMRSQSPEDSCHVLTAEALRASGARVFGLFEQDRLVATGALKPLGPEGVELKSMHVDRDRRGQGLGRALLDHMLAQARNMTVASAWLETGSAEPFAAARALYQQAGFVPCPPFGDYVEDPLSVFMTRAL